MFKVAQNGFAAVTGAIKNAGASVRAMRVNKHANKAKGILKSEIRKSKSRKKSKLTKAIEALMGKKSEPMAKKLASAVVVKSTRNGFFVGIADPKLRKLARMHDTGRKAYTIKVSKKMRGLFFALFIRGLIKAPLKRSTTSISIPRMSGHGWMAKANAKIGKQVISGVRIQLNNLFRR